MTYSSLQENRTLAIGAKYDLLKKAQCSKHFTCGELFAYQTNLQIYKAAWINSVLHNLEVFCRGLLPLLQNECGFTLNLFSVYGLGRPNHSICKATNFAGAHEEQKDFLLQVLRPNNLVKNSQKFRQMSSNK